MPQSSRSRTKKSVESVSPVVKRPMRQRALIAFVIFAPLFGLIVLLMRYSVNVPFWDQWELPTLFEKLRAGTVGFSDFFAQHNEHRILFPRLVMAGLAVLTAWNVLYEVAANVVFAIGIFWFLWLIVKRTFASSKLQLVTIGTISLILFSPIQFENWMWGWQIQWYLNVLGLVMAIWALWAWRTASPVAKLVVGILGATLATYSLASGFIVWLVCLPLVWWSKDLRALFWYWIGAALLVVGSHYIGYVDPAYHPSKLIFLTEPVQFMVYFLVYIGRPLTLDFLTAVPVAVAYLAGIAVSSMHVFQAYRRELTTALLPWICLGIYGFLAAVSTSLSRLGLGVEQAYSNRYITLSMLLLMGVVVLLVKLYERSPSTVRRIVVGGLAIIVLLAGLNYAKGIVQMKERKIHLLKVQHCAQTATSETDDCLLLLYPNKEAVWPRLQYLRSIHWGGL